MNIIVYKGDCERIIDKEIKGSLDLTFLDPPFNQNKNYYNHNDNMLQEDYWAWITGISKLIFNKTKKGGAIYFMQREKNAEQVLKALRESGWTFQNLIIWKKMTSAVPQRYRYGKQFQIIAFATKGTRPRTFHRLRIDAPLQPHMKKPRPNGLYVTDIWDEVRELTAGYFAGDEALRDKKTNERLHKQQAPISLLLRLILSSTNIGDTVLDPFSGTGTTNVVAMQLNRNSIAIEKDPNNINIINNRIQTLRKSDDITKYREYYRFTEDLDSIWEVI